MGQVRIGRLFFNKFKAVRMLADKAGSQGEGVLAVARARLPYRAFEHLIAHHAGAACSFAAEKVRHLPADEPFDSFHGHPPLPVLCPTRRVPSLLRLAAEETPGHRQAGSSAATKKPGPIS